MVPVVVGIDGGQTGTRAAAVSADGRLIGIVMVDGLVHVLGPGGQECMERVLKEIRDRLPPEAASPAAVFLALTGVMAHSRSQGIAAGIAGSIWPASIVRVENDGLAAWAGGLAGQPGVAAMAGTGSVVVGVDDTGQVAQAGGWGYLFGDAGGGWDIGSSAISLMLRTWDRAQHLSPLGSVILARLQVGSPPEVAHNTYGGSITVVQIAELAETIAHLASRGDAEARAILTQSATRFADDVGLLIDRLHWEHTPVPVAGLGRVFEARSIYRSAFRRALSSRSGRRARLVRPRLSNLGGATLMALRLADLPDNEGLVVALQKTMPATWPQPSARNPS